MSCQCQCSHGASQRQCGTAVTCAGKVCVDSTTGFAGPKIVMQAPKVALGNIQVQLSQPTVRFGAPTLRLGAPELRFTDMRMELGEPEIELGTPIITMGAPTVEMRGNVEVGYDRGTAPTITMPPPQIIIGDPKFELRGCVGGVRLQQQQQQQQSTQRVTVKQQSSREAGKATLVRGETKVDEGGCCCRGYTCKCATAGTVTVDHEGYYNSSTDEDGGDVCESTYNGDGRYSRGVDMSTSRGKRYFSHMLDAACGQVRGGPQRPVYQRPCSGGVIKGQSSTVCCKKTGDGKCVGCGCKKPIVSYQKLQQLKKHMHTRFNEKLLL